MRFIRNDREGGLYVRYMQPEFSGGEIFLNYGIPEFEFRVTANRSLEQGLSMVGSNQIVSVYLFNSISDFSKSGINSMGWYLVSVTKS